MATRNRTSAFAECRNERKRQRLTLHHSKTSEDTNAKLLELDNLKEAEQGKKELLIPSPPWVSAVESINYDISRISKQIDELSEAHKQLLLPQFDLEERANKEHSIEILTEGITRMFQQTQGKLQEMKIQSKSNPQEESIKGNIISAYATQLQELSIQLRKNQKDYLQKLKGRHQKDKELFHLPEELTEDDLNFSVAFTPQQMEVTNSNEEAVLQREREIIKIAKSIQELASIFKDLSILVIEQGTILDRIDFNIEQAKHYTIEGVKQLTKAEKSQKSYSKKLCMLLLCLCILIVIVIITIKGLIPK